MARKITYQQAINEALDQEMARDENIILMGEDVVGGSGSDGEMDAWGGVLGVTKGLYGKYGDRIMDTPISESGFVGAAIGAAAAGLRPVCELMFIDFMGVCFDQIFNQAAKSCDGFIVQFCRRTVRVYLEQRPTRTIVDFAAQGLRRSTAHSRQGKGGGLQTKCWNNPRLSRQNGAHHEQPKDQRHQRQRRNLNSGHDVDGGKCRKHAGFG